MAKEKEIAEAVKEIAKEANKDIEVVEIPTATTTAFRTSDGTLIDEKELLARIYNCILQIKKQIV